MLMGDTKKFYVNGQYICDYESTGDVDQDRELLDVILREKGLYREINLETRIFQQAVSFATTAAYLHQHDLLNAPRNRYSVVPFVVNAAFALELYLKTVSVLHGVSLRGRDLLELFDQLPPSAIQSIEPHFVRSKWPCGISNVVDFRAAIERIRHAFVEWRYLHERNAVAEVRIPEMVFALEVLHETCRAHLKI